LTYAGRLFEEIMQALYIEKIQISILVVMEIVGSQQLEISGVRRGGGGRDTTRAVRYYDITNLLEEQFYN